MFEALPANAKILWICSAGGHLAEAYALNELIGGRDDSLWVTFDTDQARSLLTDKRTQFVDYVAPRDMAKAWSAGNVVRRLVRDEQFDACISTGAAVAGFALIASAMKRVPTIYVESLTRVTGPSMTGRIARRIPGVQTICQNQQWADSHWSFQGSLLNQFTAVPRPGASAQRIFVTLGTIRPYRFDRAIDAVLRQLRPDQDVIWQLGESMRDDLPGTVHASLGFEEMQRELALADVVVSHAGVGTILAALSGGKLPVVAVRDPREGEHIDHHQREFADLLLSDGVALELDLTPNAEPTNVLDRAAGVRIARSEEALN